MHEHARSVAESMFEEMKRYVRFDEADARLLLRFREVASPHFPRIAGEFYDRIREHEAAHAVFTGEPQIARLQSSLVAWMDRICAGPHDEAYFHETAKIGRMHVRIGLSQRYMFTAMALIRVALKRIADASMGQEAPAVREAITRVLDLELAIMLETYREDFIAQLQSVERLEKQEVDRALRRTEKLAAVGRLAAGLAHEIRNPLNGAQLHVTFLERTLRKGPADPSALEAVGVIGDEIKRLSMLVTEFLEFARPRRLEKRPTSLHALCEHTLLLLAPQAEAAKVRLDHEYAATDPILDLDPEKMEQVLLNLGQNAIEALAPAGGGTVTFRVRSQPQQVSIEVEDDGPGLPDPEAPIFDPFFSTKPTGTGLGLAIAHRIVTDHDGSIDARSAPGKTIFRVTVPISRTLLHDGSLPLPDTGRPR
jgi:signal transduction histidine kinase